MDKRSARSVAGDMGAGVNPERSRFRRRGEASPPLPASLAAPKRLGLEVSHLVCETSLTTSIRSPRPRACMSWKNALTVSVSSFDPAGIAGWLFLHSACHKSVRVCCSYRTLQRLDLQLRPGLSSADRSIPLRIRDSFIKLFDFEMFT